MGGKLGKWGSNPRDPQPFEHYHAFYEGSATAILQKNYGLNYFGKLNGTSVETLSMIDSYQIVFALNDVWPSCN